MRHICTSIVATLVLAGTSLAATINVPADYTTIQAAVDAASDGDEILVAPGTYTSAAPYEVVNMRNKAVWMHSSDGPDVTIIDGEQTRRGIHCSGDVEGMTIEGFTIENCYGHTNGGGMYLDNNAQPTLKNCTFTNNTANGKGGGIYCNNSSPTISGCTISDNTANDYGGGITYWNYSSPTITGCTISNNTASQGGGISCYYSSSPTISGCTISDNTADYGGGILCNESSPTISDCMISNNTSSDIAGGLYCDNNSSPTITDCTISGNTAHYGGGMWCYENSSPTISGCTISNNTVPAWGVGGGIYCSESSPTLLNSTVCENSPSQIDGEGIVLIGMGNTVAAVCPISGSGVCCTNDACVIAEQADCLAFHGTWLGEGTTCDDSPCPTSCIGDVTGDGEVSINDLLTVIDNWGPCP